MTGACGCADAFPDPGHDHRHCAADVLARADAVCRRAGVRLTPGRRAVLEVLLAESHRPLGAYDIIERLAAGGAPPAPISVYRALNFLTGNGLVHRIERLNAFLACAGTHDSARPVVFLICETCRQVAEIPAESLGLDVAGLQARTGFVPRNAAIEILGACAHCAAAGPSAPAAG
ncbi:Fur family transcriptional regulator [Pseudoxanthobacter sp.]|uniref:Fur family transcriptional regulator n=1 Tax=Pseudoxanthobacter sp. TaxID=1925742 RepID=UPI002FDF3C8E